MKAMLTDIATWRFAAQIESAEVNAWIDLCAAAPADFARRFQLDLLRAQEVVMTRCVGIPFVHFNCVMNLGVNEPAREAQIDELLALYRSAGVSAFAFLHNPQCQPVQLTQWFKAKGLGEGEGWDRIYRSGAPQPSGVAETSDGLRVEKVNPASAGEWADFLDVNYGLPTRPWLLALAARRGWHHYLLRSGAEIVAVRSMYLHSDGMAWLGIEAPVPGVMAPSYELDRRICQVIVREGLGLGARYFVADIEAPSETMNTPAYDAFSAMGFRKLYRRSLFGPR